MNAPHILSNDPLAHAVFEKLRRNGHARTDGQTIRVEGREYGITAHAVCTLQLVHVVVEDLDDPSLGNQRAMAFLEVNQNGYHGMDGAAHLMPALIDGLVIKDPSRPAQHSWRVLPWVEVPFVFAFGNDEAEGEVRMMNDALMKQVWKSDLPTGRKMVLLGLCAFAKDGECCPSMVEISRLCGMSVRAAQGHVSVLEQMGVLFCQERIGLTTLYRIDPKQIPVSAPDTSTATDEEEQLIRAALDDVGASGQLPASFDDAVTQHGE